MKKILMIAAGAMFCMHAMAQGQPEKTEPKLTISGYAEAYYSYDFNEPENHTRPGFLYNHTRHNELNVNLAYLKANYSSGRVRANVALMAGTYGQYNLAAEQELLRYVYEANAGVRVGKNVWIDAGIMPSHIGFESAVSKDCYTLTRSIMAENTPYYETGAKVTWTPDEKWTISAMYLNGWQRIKRPDANQAPAFGTQLTFKPGSRVTLNWSTFVGNDKPDSVRQMRYFNDVYGIFNITDKFSLIAGCDYGMEEKQQGESGVNSWYSPMAVARYAFTEKIAMAARYEYYNDEKGVIIATGTPNGFKTSGYSLNLDVAPAGNVLFRVEGKMYDSKDGIFTKNLETKSTNVAITTSLAVSF
ncbi:porin [Chitinophaga sp. GCM10012297]|uniref:Porin n=1 Tax=Chitinophaga chungangae TaxID=2821488 RepID=A0ABS3YED9_9BACT|nr:porin [Chitinophaga chungangae]MBO9153047.1 porin [Chitinophaga chungangae]